MDTIFALSSGRPPAAIAVMRVSGPEAAATGVALGGRLPEPRRATLCTLRSAGGDILDRALLLWFPGPDSATGEDLLELHLHGGLAVVAAVEASLAAIPGLRPAIAGEFTRRALYNGRIDLTQAEGLSDLLTAETEAARRAAINGAEGELGRRFAEWDAELVEIAAAIEAAIDFDGEEDVAQDDGAITTRLRALARDLSAIAALPTVASADAGIRVVLIGPPNAGKSSLFNALIERDGAIVSPRPGTTRDTIEAVVIRGGQRFTLVDTAGIRDDAEDPIERLGIERTRRAQSTADLVLHLDDTPPTSTQAIWVWSRASASGRGRAPSGAFAVDIADRTLVAALWHQISALGPLGTAVLSNDRQVRHCIEAARDVDAAARQSDLVLRAEYVRGARSAISALRGFDATEAVLDALFGRFCIGK